MCYIKRFESSPTLWQQDTIIIINVLNEFGIGEILKQSGNV